MPLLMVKSILTTVVLGLSIAQAISMPQLRGSWRLLPLPPRRLRTWHRWGGDATLILTLTIAVICIIHAPFRTYPLRVPLHAAMGTLAAVVMFLKVVIARRFRRYLKHVWILGAVAGVCVLGTFAASALWYFGTLSYSPTTPPTEVTPTKVLSPTPPLVEKTPTRVVTTTPLPVEMTPTQILSPAPAPAMSGAELLQERCTACHSLDRIEHTHTQAQWEAVVELMRGYGAQLTDSEAQTLVKHLVETHGP